MKIELIDFSDCFHMPFGYGGENCRKEILSFNNNDWMIKFPSKKFGYHSVINEWLGSNVYDAVGFPVQKTMLGYLNGKLVVACKHIDQNNERLQELLPFIKNLNEKLFYYFRSGGSLSEIDQINSLLKNEKIFANINLSEYFWDIFVIDAFIGNANRHLDNIAIIFGEDFNFKRAPVYSNGYSFNAKMQDAAIDYYVSHWEKIKDFSTLIDFISPYQINGKPFLQLEYIYDNPCNDCISAIERVVPKIDFAKCLASVGALLSTELISKNRATFYTKTMLTRYNEWLLPTYEKHFGHLHRDISALSPTF